MSEKEIGNLTSEELEEIRNLNKVSVDLHLSFSRLCIQEEDIREKKAIILKNIRQEIPKKEQEFKDALTKRLGTEKWRVDGNGVIFAEE